MSPGKIDASNSLGEFGAISAEKYTVPAHIGGKDVLFSSTFDVVNPSTGKVVHQCTSATVEDARCAVDAASAAFHGWRDTTLDTRRNILLRAAEIAQRRVGELSRYNEEETGATTDWVTGFNVPLAVDILRDVAGRLTGLQGTIAQLAEPGRRAHVHKEPYGVILAIAPWNGTYILGFRSVAFAIAAGNTTVLKGSELSPRCFWAIADCFREAGLPPGVVNFIAHRPADAAAVTNALIDDPRVKKINFTGSTAVGRIVAQAAARNLKPVLLELGGKAPAIVWEDANLKLAAVECAKGAFVNAGQVCMSTERILVHKNVADAFEREFQSATQQLFADAGVLVNQAAVIRNRKLVEDAIEKGARILYGDIHSSSTSGASMRPVAVAGVTQAMNLYRQESFGPTVSLIVVESEEEALDIANDTEYGLSSAVFTQDLRRGLRFASEIEAGACHINAMTVHDETALPHGGMKSSGFGRFGSTGLDEWVRTRTVTYDI
ncbi:hypothetical protein LTS17_011646 [Exophiala oligosperma]